MFCSEFLDARTTAMHICSVIVAQINYKQRPICNSLEYYCIASEISTNNYHDI